MNNGVKSGKRFLFYCVMLFCILSLSALKVFADSSEKSIINDIRYWSASGHTRVVVYLSQPVEYTATRISNPDRVYFDLKNSKIIKEIKSNLPVGDGILKAVRAGQYDAETVRVVLDLDKMEDFNTFVLEDPIRLVIDVNSKKQVKVVAKRVVVLDPGHGGHDPGAVGSKGLYEKDVVLDIALRTRDILSKEPDLEVSLTRDKDVFIPLEERTAIARNKDADLFVSIHVNASPNRNARGIETYLLNWTNDEEAIRVAARENDISVKKMKEKMDKYRNELDVILSDLSRDYKREESMKLASYVQNSLVNDVGTVYRKTANLGVKQALFYVLVGASMPSILAEVSFISNPEEEKLLSKESYRNMLAGSIASGIRAYFYATHPQQKMAKKASLGSEKSRRSLQASSKK